MIEGRHIRIVGMGGDDCRPFIGSPEVIKNLLETIVKAVGMRPLGETVVYDVPIEIAKLKSEPFEDEGGITGVCVLSTSHCTIHTWPLRNKYVFDLYSCRDFDPFQVVKVMVRSLSTTDYRFFDLSYSLKGP